HLSHSFPTRRSSDLYPCVNPFKNALLVLSYPPPITGSFIPPIGVKIDLPIKIINRIKKIGVITLPNLSTNLDVCHDRNIVIVIKDRKSTRLNSSHVS